MQNEGVRLSIGEASKFLKVSIDTLRRWDKKGKVSSYRSPGGHRYFLKEDLEGLFAKKHYPANQEPAPINYQPISPSSDPQTNYYPEETEGAMNMVSEETLDPTVQLNETPILDTKTRETGVNIAKIFLIGLAFFAAIDAILVLFYFFTAR